jgi:hypothetical protein
LKGTNKLVYGVQNRLEKLLNDSNDSHEDKINKLEIKLSKDFLELENRPNSSLNKLKMEPLSKKSNIILKINFK